MSKGAGFSTHCGLNLDGKNRMSTFVRKDMTPLSVIMLNQCEHKEHKMLLYTRIQKSKDQLCCQTNVIKTDPTCGPGEWALYKYIYSMSANEKIWFDSTWCKLTICIS